VFLAALPPRTSTPASASEDSGRAIVQETRFTYTVYVKLDTNKECAEREKRARARDTDYSWYAKPMHLHQALLHLTNRFTNPRFEQAILVNPLRYQIGSRQSADGGGERGCSQKWEPSRHLRTEWRPFCLSWSHLLLRSSLDDSAAVASPQMQVTWELLLWRLPMLILGTWRLVHRTSRAY